MNKHNHIEYKKLYDPIVQSCFDDQGKYLIDDLGNILLENDTSLSFSLAVGSNLLAFLLEQHTIVSPEDLNQIASKKNHKTYEFSYQASKEQIREFYKLMITACGNFEQPFFLVEVVDETSFLMLQRKQQKQLERLESEIVLRTREIMNTKEAMELQGGYMHNFLRGLRHDLLSPITQLKEVISYYKKTDNPEKKKKSAVLIDDCLSKLTNTARGFSDFIDIHLLDHKQTEICDFELIFEELKSLFTTEIEAVNVTFTTDFTEVDTIKFNKKELTSILYNLLSNALKFRDLSRDLIINIQTKLTGNHIVIIIKDNGIGLDYEKYKDQLFKPFKRMNASQPGVGIGLSLVKHILDKNSGSIRIESEVGTGMKVKILLPRELSIFKPNLVEQQNK